MAFLGRRDGPAPPSPAAVVLDGVAVLLWVVVVVVAFGGAADEVVDGAAEEVGGGNLFRIKRLFRTNTLLSLVRTLYVDLSIFSTTVPGMDHAIVCLFCRATVSPTTSGRRLLLPE